MRKSILALACAILLASCERLPLAPQLQSESPAQAVGGPDSIPGPPDSIPRPPKTGDRVPGKFIVTLRDGARAEQVIADHGVEPDFVYSNVLNGFAGSIGEAARAGLLKDNRIARIERDELVALDDIFDAGGTQSNAPWGLDRVDQRALPLNNAYGYGRTGTGVTVYVLDSGIRVTHQEFGGRASIGTDVFGGAGEDCNGHGTHVAGTIGGSTSGVAKDVRLVAVKVVTCNGFASVSGIVMGLDWIVAQPARPAVVNMSLGGSINEAKDEAVRRVIAAGISVVVSAGNDNLDACTRSPAYLPQAITVGSSDSDDARSYFSNWGACIDVFAPGSGVSSSYNLSDTATAVKSGTSMAAPHVTGAAALILAEEPQASPATVAATIRDRATENAISNANSANNHVLHTLGTGVIVPPNSAPTASFGFECSALACFFMDQSVDPDGSIATRVWSLGDGTASTSANPPHAYGATGAYSVELTVTDNVGASSSLTRLVSVVEVPNATPAAQFAYICRSLSCTFTDESTDSDGQIANRVWHFGDGYSEIAASSATPSHSYAAAGSYSVTLTVMDDRGGTATVEESLPLSTITLTVTGARVKNQHRLSLTWSGISTSSADVYLNGVRLANVPNIDSYVYTTQARSRASYTFRVCTAGTQVCSEDRIFKF